MSIINQIFLDLFHLTPVINHMMEKIFFWSFILLGVVGAAICVGDTMESTRILLDTDFDTDDIFALFYILKHNRSKIDLKVGNL